MNTDKKPLVFLHGWVTSYIINKNKSIKQEYADVLDLLSHNFSVFFVELPGFGMQSLPEKPLVLSDYVSFVREFVSKNNLKEFVLAGHSFGGQIAAAFTAQYPECVSNLILYNAACIRKEFQETAASKTGRAAFHAVPFLRPIFYRLIGRGGHTALPQIMQKTKSNVVRADISSVLEHMTTHTLVLWGESDDLTPLQEGKQIAHLIPGAQLIVHPGGDHVFHKKDPGAFVGYIRTFICNHA